MDNSNTFGLKIKEGRTFKIDRILSKNENKSFIQNLLKQEILIINLRIFLDNFAEMLEELSKDHNGINVNYTY